MNQAGTPSTLFFGVNVYIHYCIDCESLNYLSEMVWQHPFSIQEKIDGKMSGMAILFGIEGRGFSIGPQVMEYP